MGKTVRYQTLIAVCALLGIASGAYAKHSRSLEIHTGSQFAPNAAPAPVKMNGDVQVTGLGCSYKPDTESLEISNPTLRTKDGLLEAKADTLILQKKRTPKGELSRTDLSGKSCTVAVHPMLEPAITASAVKVSIDWTNQVVELHGGVSVMTRRLDDSDKLVPVTMQGDSAQILLAGKLKPGQSRVQIMKAVPTAGEPEKTETKENPK